MFSSRISILEGLLGSKKYILNPVVAEQCRMCVIHIKTAHQAAHSWPLAYMLGATMKSKLAQWEIFKDSGEQF